MTGSILKLITVDYLSSNIKIFLLSNKNKLIKLKIYLYALFSLVDIDLMRMIKVGIYKLASY